MKRLRRRHLPDGEGDQRRWEGMVITRLLSAFNPWWRIRLSARDNSEVNVVRHAGGTWSVQAIIWVGESRRPLEQQRVYPWKTTEVEYPSLRRALAAVDEWRAGGADVLVAMVRAS